MWFGSVSGRVSSMCIDFALETKPFGSKLKVHKDCGHPIRALSNRSYGFGIAEELLASKIDEMMEFHFERQGVASF